MTEHEFMVRVLRATQFDCCDDLWWRGEGDLSGPLAFFIKCSDTFAYACADLEKLTPENVGDLEQAYVDCRAISRDSEMWGGALFVARARRQVPIGQFMKLLDDEPAVAALFTACAVAPS